MIVDALDDPSLGSRRRWELLALRSKKLQSDIADRNRAIENFCNQRAEAEQELALSSEPHPDLKARLAQIDAFIELWQEELRQSTAEYDKVQPRLEEAKLALQADIRTFLQEAVIHSGLPPATLARRAAVSASTITRPLNDPEFSFIPRSATLQKIADAAGIPVPRSFTAGRPPPAVEDTPEIRIVPIYGEARLGSWRPETDETAEAEAWDRGDWAPVSLTEYAATPLSAYRITRPLADETSVVVIAPRHATGIRVGDDLIVRRWSGSFSETALWRVVAGPPIKAAAIDSESGEELELETGTPEARPPEILGVVIQTIRTRSSKGPLIG